MAPLIGDPMTRGELRVSLTVPNVIVSAQVSRETCGYRVVRHCWGTWTPANAWWV